MLCFFSLPQRSKFSIKNPPIRRRKGLAGICRRILISLAAGSFFLSACAAEETKSGESLYIDLNEYTAYLKDGFNQEDITGPPDLSPNSWRIIEERTGNKKRTIQIRYSGLMSIPYRTFLSPLGEKDREYTLLIPFTINREQFEILKGDNAFQPGIFLAALGDNWEIFLNGKKVKSEVYLDQEGQIRSHRSRRSVFFSLDKSLFAQGSNLLAFRILGAPDYNKTGLFYHAPYYIGDYGQIAQENNESLLIAQCGIYIFIGFYHLLLFFPRRQERYNLYYGIFSVLLGIYVFLRTHAGLPVIPDSAVLLRLEYGCFCMIMPMMSAFLESLNFKKISLGNKIYGTCCLFLALSQGIFSLPYGEDALFLAWRLVPCGIVYVFVYDIGYAFFCLVHKKWKEDKNVPLIKNLWVSIISTPQGNILIGALFFLVVGFLNIVYGLKSQAGTIHYINHGFFAFTIITTLILVRRFGNLFSRLDYMNNTLELINANLENTVKERTRDLEQQTRRAESASRAKSAFLARMSHEIRTPMNAVIGMSELALREEARPHLMIEYVQDIKQAGISLLAIINDILDFSKIETGNLEIVPGSYSLSTLINDVINLVRVRITEKGLIFMVDAEASLPERLHGDEVRIRQILLNLLSNAAKYTHQGYVKLTVRGSPEKEEGLLSLYFEVADSGIGIKAEDTEQLFGDFVRVDLERNKGIEGTGLGLAITRNLCRLMGGNISVSSEYGRGSVFTAHIRQSYAGGGVLAAVENPASKESLLLHENPAYAESFRFTLENLGVPVKMYAQEREGFFRELETGAYAFAFVSIIFAAETTERIKARSLKTVPVLLEGLDKKGAMENMLRLPMPAYSVPAAIILNGNIRPERRLSGRVRFIAPAAEILLVDDIPTNLKVAAGLLALYQIKADTVLSGIESVNMVQQKNYDIVFMDHMMPGMDGVEATARIRALGGRFRELPIIALTANVVSEMREMFLKSGFNDYLAKPIEMIRLDDILRTWLPEQKREIPHSAAPSPGAQKISSPGEEIPPVEGLDIKRGITMTGGSPGVYREILELYCKDVEKRLDILSQVPRAETLPLFTTLVHALKSASANIGAAALSEEAARLEIAGRERDMTAIREHLDQFRENLLALSARIRQTLS